jgi:hypothetical protein
VPVSLYATRTYLDRSADTELLTELAAFDGLDAAELRPLLAAHVAMDPHLHRPITLFATAGEYLAGSQLRAPHFQILAEPTDRPFTFTLRRNGRAVPFRGVARNDPGGQRLLVAQDMASVRAFRSVLLESTLWGGLAGSWSSWAPR